MTEPVQIKATVKCCKNCGNCTVYKHKPYRYECAGKVVQKNGICDRYVKNYSPSEVIRRMDRRLRELERMTPEEYVPKELPPFHQNYRELTEEELTK